MHVTTQGGRWLVLWIAAAAAAAIGGLLFYLGPNLYPTGKGVASPNPFLGQGPIALTAVGMVGMVVGAAGIVRSRRRAAVDRGTTRYSDVAAIAGFLVAAGALVAVILTVIVWPVVASSLSARPCDQDPTVACFRAHPDFYQEIVPGSGGYSTPVSRIADDIVTPVFLSAWPLGLAGATLGVIALATATRLRRLAILGVVLGTLTVAGMGLQFVGFFIGGGD